jgi:3-oxoacyl-[acyl-carrier protein] reductase
MSLSGRVAVVTGVSRRRGIGCAVAVRLTRMGASLAVHHHAPHDVAEYGHADDLEALLAELRGLLCDGARLVDIADDAASSESP